MPSLDLAVIGNCQIASLLDERARIVWTCLPQFDADPVFCSLLQETEEPESGFFDIELVDFVHSERAYERNTAIVETRLHDRRGGVIKIIDFAPRYYQFGRTFRPMMVVRRIEPEAALVR